MSPDDLRILFDLVASGSGTPEDAQAAALAGLAMLDRTSDFARFANVVSGKEQSMVRYVVAEIQRAALRAAGTGAALAQECAA